MELPPGFDWELIVVDNNSTDRTREVAEEFAQSSGVPVRYVFEHNQGLSHARNRGIREAHGDMIAFTDDDVTVERSWLVSIKNAFDVFDCMAVGGKIVPLWNGAKPRWFSDERGCNLGPPIVQFDLGNTARRINRAFVGANMAFKKEVFARHGLFRADLGRVKRDLGVGEETEFCKRLLDAGEVVVYAPQAIVYHPVEKQRTRKAYFQSWYFNNGKILVRSGEIPKNAVCYFGVPRYLFRMMAQDIIRWFCGLSPRRRFYSKLQVYALAGMISECRNSRSVLNEIRANDTGTSGD